MKAVKIILILSIVMGLIIAHFSTAAPSPEDGKHQYIGIKKCKVCHSSAKRGKQYQQWAASEHAKAYEHLATPEAKAVAEKAGVTGNPQEAAECLSCHATGYNAPAAMKAATLTLEEGISCESCHGAGGDYWKLSTMKKVAAGEVDAASVGLIPPSKELCLECHNEKSPTYEGFDFEARLKEVLHKPSE